MDVVLRFGIAGSLRTSLQGGEKGPQESQCFVGEKSDPEMRNRQPPKILTPQNWFF